MPTLLLDRSAVVKVTDLVVLGDALGAALGRHQVGGTAQRVRSRIGESVTSMVLVPGLADGVPAYTVKVHAKSPGAAEGITGVILLHDLATGELLSVMDSGWLTAQRTALTAAFVHDQFVDPQAPVAVVGAGVQGTAVAHALQRRHRRRFLVTDTDQGAAQELSASLGSDSAEVADTAQEALESAPSVVTTTWGTAPIATTDAFASIRHVTMLGADEPGKQELPADVLQRAHVYADDPGLVEPVLSRATTAISGVLGGAARPAGMTIYAAVGLPMQDLVAAWHVYQRARLSTLGSLIDLRS